VFEALKEKQNSIKRSEEQLRSLDSKAGQQEAKLKSTSFDTFRAYEWVLKNADKFEHEVFGPPMMTCSMRDPKYANAVESLFSRTDFMTFTTQSRNDFRVLQKSLIGGMKLHDVSIKTCSASLQQFQPPTSQDELRKLGFDGWASEYLSGPEPVLAMLCSENRLHQTPISLRDISNQQYSKMQNGPISSWVAGKQSYQVIRRREYGPGAVSTRTRPIRPAHIWTDQPADPSAKQELQMRIAECTADIKSIQEKVENDRTELASLKDMYNDKTRDKVSLQCLSLCGPF
jgi:structural maintenance of chromosomes protein 5